MKAVGECAVVEHVVKFIAYVVEFLYEFDFGGRSRAIIIAAMPRTPLLERLACVRICSLCWTSDQPAAHPLHILAVRFEVEAALLKRTLAEKRRIASKCELKWLMGKVSANR